MASIGMLACMGAPVFGQLLLDFNSTTQDGGPHPQVGYESYDAGHEVAADFDTKSYTAFGTTVSVTPVWPSTTDNRVMQMIDRGAANDADWLGDKIDLLTDWLGSDTRTANGGNGDWDRTVATNPTYLTITLNGLPADTYQWTSYHHDTENMWGDFQVEVSTDGGSTYGAPVDMKATSSNESGGNPQSPNLETGDPDPEPRNLPSTFVTLFAATGGQDVVLRFANFAGGVDPTGVHKQFFLINGFEITGASALPGFSLHPQDQDVILGDAATLAATASSASPVSLQWRKDGTPIPDATNSTLQIDVTSLADEGTYDVVAVNASGSATSDPAVLTVVLPAIAPATQVVLATFPATFTITLPTNTTGYTYAWNGPAGAIAGATNEVLTVTDVDGPDAGTYSVDVTLGGDTLSQTASLIVPPPPAASYPNTVLGDGPAAYWRLGESPAAATVVDEVAARTLTVGLNTVLGQPGSILGDADTAAGFDGTADSALDALDYDSEVNPAVFSLEFWGRPTGGAGRRAAIGSRDIFNDPVIVEGYEVGLNAAGQWEFRTGDGAAWNTLTGPAAGIGDWSHVVATYNGTDMELFVNGVSVAALPGVTVTAQSLWGLRVGASANENAAAGDVFVGDLDEVAIYGAALSAADVLDHYVATFDVTALPVVATQPETQGVLIGTQGVFQVSALSGTYPTYQWRRGGVELPGETNDTLVIDPVTLDSGGEYDVVVSNDAGSTASESALLVPLQDYLGSFVLPDAANTVLTRNDSADWFAIEGVPNPDTAALWNRRAVFAIEGGSIAPWGWQGVAASEANGNLELRTTITGLDPNTDYAVWTLFSDKSTGGLSEILTAFDGEEMIRFDRFNGIDIGLIAVSTGDPWPVYHCFLGVRNSGPSGTLSVLADYADGAGRTVYHGLGYQLAVPGAAPPVISIPPASQAVLIGSNATFNVAASSVLPLSYQWQFNGVDLTGETNASLTVPSVQRADAGMYRAVVSNDEGSVPSDEAHLVALVDYVGTFVYPDAGNTVLTRNGSPDWFIDTQADAESNGWWWARSDFAIPGVDAATNGFFSNSAMENAGDVQIRTTVTGLTPGEEYAIWILYSFPPGDAGSRIGSGFAGEIPTTWDDGLGQNIGVTNGPTANYAVYQGFLGVQMPDGSGEIDVEIDYRGLSQSVYNGLGYQLAILPPDVTVDIDLVGGAVTVTWPDGSGVLQESEDLTNPAAWMDVPGATSPHTDPNTTPEKAFRLVE